MRTQTKTIAIALTALFGVLASHLADSLTTPSQCAVREEDVAALRVALERLEPIDREVLVLRYLEQLSTVEISAVLGLTVDGVKSRQRRALERFSNLLADHSLGNA